MAAMKEKRKNLPNPLLRRAREHHGWSQKYVADQLGTNAFTVNRWEQGVTFPGPSNRQLLCKLFDMSIEELGLIPPRRRSHDGQSVSPDIASPPSGQPALRLYDPLIPHPSGIKNMVGRESLLKSLKQQLFQGQAPMQLALHGLPGVGKTVLLIALAHDPEVQAYFQDGILWAGLGYNPNVTALLSRWGKMLGVPDIEASKLARPADWAQSIHTAIGTRRLLLIIDDAWEIEEAFTFQLGGPNCAHLLTTRSAEIALQFSSDGTTTVPELNEDDGVALLARLAPEIVNDSVEKARSLVRSVGGLPLALTLMGKYLRRQAYSGQRRRVQRALDRLSYVEERLRLTMPIAPAEASRNLPAGVPLSLQTAISISDQQLSQIAHQALCALSLFPCKPDTFSEEAALAAAAVPVEVLDTLTDASLLESCGEGRYTLHRTIADYARLQLTDSTVEERIVSFFVSFAEANRDHYDALERDLSCLRMAFDLAYERGMDTALVRGVNACAPFWSARGLHALAEMHLNRAQQAALALGDDEGQALTWLYLGQIAEQRGDPARAEEMYQQGMTAARRANSPDTLSALLARLGEVMVQRDDTLSAEHYLWEGIEIARKLGNTRRISTLLKGLGEVADSRGLYDQGNQFYEEGLKLARQDCDYEMMSVLLQNLGVKAERRGEMALSQQLYAEGLEYARKIGHKQRISALLMNMGMSAINRGEYARARDLSLESLQLARTIGNRMRISGVLQNLGILGRLTADYEQSARYLEESLGIAREMGYNWLTSETLCEWGELHLRLGELEQAKSDFEEALALAREMEGAELIGFALYGLARIAAAQGDYAQAQQLGQESLAVNVAMGHRRADEVAEWLATLPPLS